MNHSEYYCALPSAPQIGALVLPIGFASDGVTQKASLKKAFRFFLNSKFNLIKPDKLSVCLLLECKHTSHRVERKQTHRLPPANNLQLRASKTGLIRCQECHH